MDVAVVDRIRMLHDEGMPPSRIASTMGMTERDVVRQLPAEGIYVGTVTRPSSHAPAKASDDATVPFVAPPSGPAPSDDVKSNDDPVQKRKRGAPAVRVGVTQTEAEAWRLCHDDGMRGMVKVAEGTQDAAHGMTASPATGPDVVIQSAVIVGETVTTTGEPTTHVDGTLRILAAEPVVISGADHAQDIPGPIPGPMPDEACAVCGCTDYRACPGGCEWVEDDLCSACLVASDAAITSDPRPFTADHKEAQPRPVSDPRLDYVAMLLDKAEAHGLGAYGDRIERVLGIDVDRDLWAEGYRSALRDILDRMATMDSTTMRFNLTNAIARLAIDPPQA